MTLSAVSFDAETVETYDDPAAAHAAPGKTWVRVTDDDPEIVERVTAEFDIHPLSVEDIRGDTRPKIEEFADHTFLLIKTAKLRGGETTFEDEIRTTPVGIFLGADWIVTLSVEPVEAVDTVWETVHGAEPRHLERSADFTAYRIIDRIVDSYFHALDEIETEIETIEDSVVETPDEETLEHINEVRRDLLSFRKVLWPTREAVGPLARGDIDQVDQRTEKYFRDVYDHLVQLVDLNETYRDLVSGARDIYLNALSMSTNEVMKRLTIVATIVLPLTFIAGVYGMNFGGGGLNMPELEWGFGYPAVMLGMGAVAAILLVHFRRLDWL
jgi:magnesium transporter